MHALHGLEGGAELARAGEEEVEGYVG